MYRSILVPIDGSPLSEQALPLAQDLARRTGATLHVVRVHIPSSAPLYTAGLPLADTRLDERASTAERAYLAALAARLRTQTDISVDTVLVDGAISDSVADLIVGYTRDQPIDLVVMTTHGRGGLAHFWLGSVAEELVRRLPVPVLLLHPNTHPTSAAALHTPERILIPLDGSANAEAVLPYALALGEATQTEYILLRVIEPVMLTRHLPPNPAVRELDDQLLDQQRLDAQIYLERLAESVAVQGRHVRVEVAVAARAASAILEEAQQEHSDLIAMGTHARRGLARMLLGSAAHNVLHGARLPVLLYHTPNKELADV